MESLALISIIHSTMHMLCIHLATLSAVFPPLTPHPQLVSCPLVSQRSRLVVLNGLFCEAGHVPD